MKFAIALLSLLFAEGIVRGEETKVPPPPTVENGYRGIWYANQPLGDKFFPPFKYSGGMATYPQQHVPIAIYSKEANKTFFCYGGTDEEGKTLLLMVSYFDHATQTVPRPICVLRRKTDDAHFNPTLSLDAAGRIYVFCNTHGGGSGLPADDPTRGTAYIFRSKEPYSIDAFDCQIEKPFSYSQVWKIDGKGLLWLHTRYAGSNRKDYVSTSADGLTWSKPAPMMDIEKGSYQVSTSDGVNVVTAFDFHPTKGGLNARTNLYFLQSADFGKTWTNVVGQPVDLPLRDIANPALVHDYKAEGLLVYIKDVVLDKQCGPLILFLTSKGWEPGPESGPRDWKIARWNGEKWVITQVLTSDHNYDHGSLYIDSDGVWRVVAPVESGAQSDTTGGRISIYESINDGSTWRKTSDLTSLWLPSQNYIRRPQPRHDEFYAFWADGDPWKCSKSLLYFCNKEGDVFRLPALMSKDAEKPEPVR